MICPRCRGQCAEAYRWRNAVRIVSSGNGPGPLGSTYLGPVCWRCSTHFAAGTLTPSPLRELTRGKERRENAPT